MAPFGRDWKRPANLPFPKTWRRFKGLKPMPDGRIPEFWIQDATDDMAMELAEHMQTSFSRDEEMAKAIGMYEHFRGRPEPADLIASLVLQRFSLVAFTDWPDGKPHLAGCNLLYIFGQGDTIPKVNDDHMRKLQSVMFLTLGQVDVYRKFNVEAFTTALGLSVAKDFRGQSVGVELLKARVQLTKAIGLRLTLNNFTGIASQKQAARAGYDLLYEVAYKDIKDYDGSVMFPGVQTPTLQFRARYIDDDTTDEDLAK